MHYRHIMQGGAIAALTALLVAGPAHPRTRCPAGVAHDGTCNLADADRARIGEAADMGARSHCTALAGRWRQDLRTCLLPPHYPSGIRRPSRIEELEDRIDQLEGELQ